MAKVLRVCGDLVAGFTRLECSPLDCEDHRTLCEYLEAKLGLAKVTQIELWNGRTFTTLSPRGPPPAAALPERSTLRVTATAAGARAFPYTLHDAAGELETSFILPSYTNSFTLTVACACLRRHHHYSGRRSRDRGRVD